MECSLQRISSNFLLWKRNDSSSQWNPVYNAFYQFFCCGNETIRQEEVLTRLETPEREKETQRVTEEEPYMKSERGIKRDTSAQM